MTDLLDRTDQDIYDAQTVDVGAVNLSDPTLPRTTTIASASGPNLSRLPADPQTTPLERALAGVPLDSAHRDDDTHHLDGAVDTSGPDQRRRDTQKACVGATISTPPAKILATPTKRAPEGWLILRIWSESFYDCQKNRIGLNNRAERGGVPPELFAGMIAHAEQAENEARLNMCRTYRKAVPASIIEWQKSSRGIGEHLLARLLGTIGDPLIATPLAVTGKGADRTVVANGDPYERTVSQLWRYCGWSPDHRPHAGMTQADMLGCGKGQAKMLTRLMAEGCVKSGGPYRTVYDDAKARSYVSEAHTEWTPGHHHNHALRVTAKAILRDLWRAAKNLPPAEAKQVTDTHTAHAGLVEVNTPTNTQEQ